MKMSSTQNTILGTKAFSLTLTVHFIDIMKMCPRFT